LRAIARAHPRWGWKTAHVLLRREGHTINKKRTRRLWREEGLKVPFKRRKKRLTGIGTHVGAMCPIRPNALWALDFQFDTLANGKTIKMLNLIDEYTREEQEVSYRRRILHGKIDILRAELVARLQKSGGRSVLDQVDVDRLTDILTGKASPPA